MRGAGSPDKSADPGKSRKDHVHNSAEHEDLKGTVPIAELAEKETQNTIAETEEEPANQTRSQEITGSAEKAKNGNRSKKAENRGGSDVAFLRETLQKRDMIGDHQPGRKDQSEANADIDACTDSRVAEEVEPTITG
jgi:hypothetical protein